MKILLLLLIATSIASLIALMLYHIVYLRPFSLKRYREKTNKLSSYCVWECFFDDEVVLLKGGALLKCYTFSCPDLGSASAVVMGSTARLFNEAVKKLGSGWAIGFEVQRVRTNTYPAGSFIHKAAFLLDYRRLLNFEREDHFVSHYYLSFTYQLPQNITEKAKGLFFTKKELEQSGLHLEQLHGEIDDFKMQCDKVIRIFANKLSVTALQKDACLTFLHSTVSRQWHQMIHPPYTMFLDRIITDSDLDTGMPLKLGDEYIPILAINDFPNATYPAMLDALNMAKVEYRWSTRFIGLDRSDAEHYIERYIKKHHGSLKGFGQQLTEIALKVESTRINESALTFEGDSQAAKTELLTDTVGFGYYTANLMCWDTDMHIAREKSKYLAGIISSCGFGVKEETLNAFEAFLSMMPGNVYANVRRPLLSTGNLSHVVPSSTVWEGQSVNLLTKSVCADDIPHLICSTNYGTPFYLNLSVGDVMHTLIFGPTGAGKSTLLALLELQWLKYKNSRVIVLDKDKSARSVTMAVGGSYVEPGTGDCAFQPLADLETTEQRIWAVEFIEVLLLEQKIIVTASMRKAINDAIQIMASRETSRTLSDFWNMVSYEDDTIRVGLEPYVLTGQYGSIFDADTSNIPITRFTMIEMGTLMQLSRQAVVPALFYIFQYIERFFDGNLTLLVLDEAWMFLDNPVMARKIKDWLKTLRKKHVACVFATQEVSDASRSEIASTLIGQCLTKIYLADPSAVNASIEQAYEKFGLEDWEIEALINARMKQDYFYKSPLGTRMFQLDLDSFQLALLSPNHMLLDELEETYGRNSGKELAKEILAASGFSAEVTSMLQE